MLRRRIYYELKPYLPWKMRMGVRRIAARRLREQRREVWPINPAAGLPPAGWPGWPGGAEFAFVLTHDVEGPEGLAQCRALAEVEMQLGFRSAFNFIPEGTYSVSTELRSWLVANGFEVGIHDLNHDGHLYSSQRAFLQKAKRINQYAQEWGARGFRSGFMLRNLDWIHELNIQYDSSTFDTDPFELQSDGVGTIFPYWIARPAGTVSGSGDHPDAKREGSGNGSLPRRQGYIELPYTMPQDSTLFLVFQERSTDIWTQKLDWIVAHRGMALVNVHPDYIAFPGRSPSPRQYSVDLYTNFLRSVSQRFAGRYWSPLPTELASWFQENCLQAAAKPAAAARRHEIPTVTSPRPFPENLSGKRAAVLLYSNYPADPRPRREAEILVKAGMAVDLLCLSETESDPLSECINGVQVHRLPMQRRRAGRRTYLWQYGKFILSAFWFMLRNAFRRKYHLVHVHNMPDILVFSALVPKLMGAKVVLDLHDPMPELMMTIFGAPEDSLQIRFLKFLERCSIAFSDAVLTVNEACKRIFSGRSCASAKVSVVMNSPDEGIFQYRPAGLPVAGGRAGQPKFVVMYHGSLVARHGLDLAVDAIKKLRPTIPTLELHVYGQATPYLETVMESVEKLGLKGAVIYHGSASLESIVEAIRTCDVGIIPNRRSIFTELNTPTRIFEYLSQGKPVIAPRAPGILDYFGPDDLIYFELGDAEDLGRKLAYVFNNPIPVAATVDRGQAIYRQHCWSSEQVEFLGRISKTLQPQSFRPTGEPVPVQTSPKRG